jgi:hypothetical protein
MLMKTVLSLGSGRKRIPVFAAVAWCALATVLFPGCASRKEFQKGYDRGAADTVKRQYWIQQNLQKGEKASPYRLTIYRMPVAPDPDAKVKTVPYEIAIPIYE